MKLFGRLSNSLLSIIDNNSLFTIQPMTRINSGGGGIYLISLLGIFKMALDLLSFDFSLCHRI